ncbi:cytochrome o ubiquinol oxidase subunit IV [Candidatus Blochmannia ocreatus (nom. nud.)]|uniref:Cytochrome bo(3) ubiquinol oxidase subunit 4 n=1 Tax=Candidatus Blochmannia ocreatus (nom. nud.) TaxID=251538 RepID=A0ABY4SZP5_9ENTR|nr:cytochrome o ubiquinol oxidase subunit IV [Candidatus Blochmannia ocreatus]URJ25309.1 cytochrome o ubiquinol oxidase subunit IV [Candidatus Blochmannia ocreatus]
MKNDYTQKSYFIGFILSGFLTILPFSMSLCTMVHKDILITIIILCAVVQIGVHLVCFLHLYGSLRQLWYLIFLIFTLFIAAVLFLGSIWIMKHLHHNVMI